MRRFFLKNWRSVFSEEEVDHLQGKEECLALQSLIMQENTTFQQTTLSGKIENTLIKIFSVEEFTASLMMNIEFTNYT